MTWAMFVTGILVGLLTGALAGFVMKGGGFGLIWDLRRPPPAVIADAAA